MDRSPYLVRIDPNLKGTSLLVAHGRTQVRAPDWDAAAQKLAELILGS